MPIDRVKMIEILFFPETLKQFAKNDKGEVIPDELIGKMLKARNFGKGLLVRHQMYYAALAMAYYSQNPKGLDTTEVAKTL